MGKEKSKKRRKSSEDSSSSSSESSQEKKKIRKLKKKLKKEQKKTEKALKKKLKEQKRKLKKKRQSVDKEETTQSSDIPIELMERSKAMAPMTKEEWEQRQSVVRKVLDEETGRYRLIKGDGEVLEEIVPRDRHRQINKQATMADGEFFQTHTTKQLK